MFFKGNRIVDDIPEASKILSSDELCLTRNALQWKMSILI
jgi:hypothetical protein